MEAERPRFGSRAPKRRNGPSVTSIQTYAAAGPRRLAVEPRSDNRWRPRPWKGRGCQHPPTVSRVGRRPGSFAAARVTVTVA